MIYRFASLQQLAIGEEARLVIYIRQSLRRQSQEALVAAIGD